MEQQENKEVAQVQYITGTDIVGEPKYVFKHQMEELNKVFAENDLKAGDINLQDIANIFHHRGLKNVRFPVLENSNDMITLLSCLVDLSFDAMHLSVGPLASITTRVAEANVTFNPVAVMTLRDTTAANSDTRRVTFRNRQTMDQLIALLSSVRDEVFPVEE